jgi:hypothetical protein
MPNPAERHYSPGEVAESWHLHIETIRRLFQDESCVVVLQSRSKRGGARTRPSGFHRVSSSEFTNDSRGNMSRLC